MDQKIPILETEFQKKLLHSRFNHIALPSWLPQKQELHIAALEQALVNRLLGAVRVIRDAQAGVCYRVWDSLRISLESYKALHVNGHLERSHLMSRLRQLQTADLIILHVANQNAGIFIHKPTE